MEKSAGKHLQGKLHSLPLKFLCQSRWTWQGALGGKPGKEQEAAECRGVREHLFLIHQSSPEADMICIMIKSMTPPWAGVRSSLHSSLRRPPMPVGNPNCIEMLRSYVLLQKKNAEKLLFQLVAKHKRDILALVTLHSNPIWETNQILKSPVRAAVYE